MTEAAQAAPPAGPLVRLAGRLGALSGWRRLAAAALLGAVSAAALPPLYLVPLLLPAFTGLVWLLDGAATRRGAFAVGWAFGVGQFAAGLYWVGIAFLVDAPTYGWMMPFAVVGLSAGLAIFPGAATLAVRLVGWTGAARVLLLAVAWSAAAWLRGHVLTGFPWNLMGTAWSFSDAAVQSVAVFGVWGLTLLTVFAAAAPATLSGPGGAARRWGPSLAAALLLALAVGGGALRLAAAPAPGAETVPDVRLRIVQARIPQDLKWQRDLRTEHLKRHLQMTRGPDLGEISHVIWPETAVPFFLSRTKDLREALASVAPKGGALITGLPRLAGEGENLRLHNSLVAIGPDGETLAGYDKFHLVPFGEYVPLRDWLPFEKLTAGRTDFAPGPGPRTLEIPGLPPVSPLICYEAIFPGGVLDPAHRPAWLLNVTNDAWFGDSSGPHQHLASAKLRAVEQGLPLVRAANTGISVVVDPYGRTLHRLDLGARGIIDSRLPAALTGLTPYARFGDGVFFALLIAGLALAFALQRR